MFTLKAFSILKKKKNSLGLEDLSMKGVFVYISR